jgi:hypothetical protein
VDLSVRFFFSLDAGILVQRFHPTPDFLFGFLARAVMAVIPACLLSFYPLLGRQAVVDIHASADEVLAQGPGQGISFYFVDTDRPISTRYEPLLQEMSNKYRQQATFHLVFPDNRESTDRI